MKTIDDQREDKSEPWAFVVFTDSFMSGWGSAFGGRSLFALAVDGPSEGETVLANGKNRSEMKRGRIVKGLRVLIRSVKPNDHLSIRDRQESDRWYQPNGFAEV